MWYPIAASTPLLHHFVLPAIHNAVPKSWRNNKPSFMFLWVGGKCGQMELFRQVSQALKLNMANFLFSTARMSGVRPPEHQIFGRNEYMKIEEIITQAETTYAKSV